MVPFCGNAYRYQLRDGLGLQRPEVVLVCGKHLERAHTLFRSSKRPVCEHCGADMPVPAREQGGGRTKRYCSGRCRTAAHRARPPSWGPDTLHGALGTDRVGG